MTTDPAREYVDPESVDPDDFPASTRTAEGVRTLEADPTPRYGAALLHERYAERSGRPLHVQVLLPPGAQLGSSERYPLVVFVQGSAWREQMLGANLAALAAFTERGYVVAMVEYRPSDLAPFPAQVRDTTAAIRFLRSRASDYLIDPNAVAIWGDSSGGHTALLTFLSDGVGPLAEEGDGARLGLRCCVDYYGPSDVSRMNEEPSVMDHLGPDSPEGLLIGGVDVLANPERVAPTVVMNHLGSDAGRGPILMVHGDRDRLVPFGQSVLLYEALRAEGRDVTFYRLAGADHGGPPFWSRQVLDVVDRFLRSALTDTEVRTAIAPGGGADSLDG